MSDEADEAEFIEFEFGDFEKATLAERAFPTSFASLGTSIALRASIVDDMGEAIRAKLEEIGLTWTEAPSSLTEEDLWPRWPEDEHDEDDEDEEPASPSP